MNPMTPQMKNNEQQMPDLLAVQENEDGTVSVTFPAEVFEGVKQIVIEAVNNFIDETSGTKVDPNAMSPDQQALQNEIIAAETAKRGM